MRDAEVLSGGLMPPEKPEPQLEPEPQPKPKQANLDQLKTELAEVMAEEREAVGKHNKLMIAQLELTAQVSESETKLDQLAAKKAALQAQAIDLAKKNGKGKR